jgi:hypothetical protein
MSILLMSSIQTWLWKLTYKATDTTLRATSQNHARVLLQGPNEGYLYESPAQKDLGTDKNFSLPSMRDG